MNDTTLIIVGFGVAQSILLGVLAIVCVQLVRHVTQSNRDVRDDISEMVLAKIDVRNRGMIQDELRSVKHSLLAEIKMEREGILTLLVIDFESRIQALMSESRWGELDGPLSAIFQFAGAVSSDREAIQTTILNLCGSLTRTKDLLTTSSRDCIIAYLRTQPGVEAERLRNELEKTSEPG